MKAVIAASIALIFTACGGGGGGGEISDNPVASSSSSSSSSSAPEITIQPLAEGSGTFVISSPGGSVIKIDEDGGYLEYLPNPLPKLYAVIDSDEDGYVYAYDRYGDTIDKIDILSGEAVTLFSVPVGLTTFTVTPQGTILAATAPQDFQKRYLVEYSTNGELLREIESESAYGGMGYDASGQLIGSNFGFIWTVDIDTAETERIDYPIDPPLVSSILSADLDISKENELRASDGETLFIYNLNTGYFIKQTLLIRSVSIGNPAILHR